MQSCTHSQESDESFIGINISIKLLTHVLCILNLTESEIPLIYSTLTVLS